MADHIKTEAEAEARVKARPDFSGMDLDAENDEEYDENSDEEVVKRGKKRARKVDNDDEVDVKDGEGEPEGEDGEDGEDASSSEEETAGVVIKKGPKKRGRKKLKVIVLDEGTFDEEGNPLNVKDDEVIIANEDPQGILKVDENGNLADGREYRNVTFKINGSPKLWMISTEPARLVGFRDSYLLFKTHRSLFKKVCTNDEKFDLIDRQIIPNSYKGRSVNLVAARSIYREFGAKIIKNGKKVTDDFWEKKAIDDGDVPGEYADPQELFNKNRYGNLFDQSATTAGSTTPLAGTALINYQSDPSWIHQIAKQTQGYNNELKLKRNQAAVHGVKDAYTNLIFLPKSTQCTTYKIKKIGNASKKIVYKTVFQKADEGIPTGLRLVPKEIFEDSENVKEILDQQHYEKSLAL